ncbi:hypothetical protein DAI22_04g081701 [Oryza sativa Japonica Group]|nr:hypothetical protein DAI22_04g081701 [Oryza sativa Japonica Group]
MRSPDNYQHVVAPKDSLSHSPFPHPCYSQIPNPHPKILTTSAPRILAADRRRRLLAEQAVSATTAVLPSQPALSPSCLTCQRPGAASSSSSQRCRSLPLEPLFCATSLWSRLPLSSSRGANIMVSTATNHLVHGHLLASCGCCSSAPPHLSNCRYFTAQISFALLSIQ